MRAATIAPCRRCLAEPPGRMLGLGLAGVHHLCDLDVWRAALPNGQTYQTAGAGERCPVCHGRGHGGAAASSGPPSCPGADQLGPPGWLPPDLAAERAAEAARAFTRRAAAARAVLTGFLLAVVVLVLTAAVLVLGGLR